MTYQTTITRKGQVTIPKEIRDILNLTRFRKVFIELGENKQEIKIKPSQDFLTVAKNIKMRRRQNPLKARKAMQSWYQRRINLEGTIF